MALVSYALVTLDNTKTFLGITGTSNDSLLEMLINQVTDYIETRTDRRFAETTYTEEVYDGEDCATLVLRQLPITTFTKLEKNNATDNSDSWEEIDSDNYWVDELEGILTKTTLFRRGKQNYRATYTAGYSEIPYDIQFLAMSLISDVFNRRKNMGVLKETLGDHSIEFERFMQENQSQMKIISNYRKIPIC